MTQLLILVQKFLKEKSGIGTIDNEIQDNTATNCLSYFFYYLSCSLRENIYGFKLVFRVK